MSSHSEDSESSLAATGQHRIKKKESSDEGSSEPSQQQSSQSEKQEAEEEAEEDSSNESGHRPEEDSSDEDAEQAAEGHCVSCSQEFGAQEKASAEPLLVSRRQPSDRECKICFNARQGAFGRGDTQIRGKKRTGGKAAAKGQYFPDLLKKHKHVRKAFDKARKDAITGARKAKGRATYDKQDCGVASTDLELQVSRKAGRAGPVVA